MHFLMWCGIIFIVIIVLGCIIALFDKTEPIPYVYDCPSCKHTFDRRDAILVDRYDHEGSHIGSSEGCPKCESDLINLRKLTIEKNI